MSVLTGEFLLSFLLNPSILLYCFETINKKNFLNGEMSASSRCSKLNLAGFGLWTLQGLLFWFWLQLHSYVLLSLFTSTISQQMSSQGIVQKQSHALQNAS